MNSKSTDTRLLNKLRDPDYRNALVSSTVAARLAARIYNLRKKKGWTQQKLASEAGMKQARISLLEQADYENFSFNTLKRIAAALGVAVVVDFVSFPDFLAWRDKLDSESVAPASFDESLRPRGDSAGLDHRDRDVDGKIRRKRGDTSVKTLRETYGNDCAPGVRGDTRLGTLRTRSRGDSPSKILKR